MPRPHSQDFVNSYTPTQFPTPDASYAWPPAYIGALPVTPYPSVGGFLARTYYGVPIVPAYYSVHTEAVVHSGQAVPVAQHIPTVPLNVVHAPATAAMQSRVRVDGSVPRAVNPQLPGYSAQRAPVQPA